MVREFTYGNKNINIISSALFYKKYHNSGVVVCLRHLLFLLPAAFENGEDSMRNAVF